MARSALALDPRLQDQIQNTTLPESLGFGKFRAPIMVQSTFRDGAWSPLSLGAYTTISLDPSAKVLHYGQAIFEGLKAFKNAKGVALFRPDEHAKRFAASAKRIAMPLLPEEMFLDACCSMAHHLKPMIPQGDGESLYLRPTMIATEAGLGLAVAKEYLFFVIASPAGGYFAAPRVQVLIERNECRASVGGTGSAKVAGNYAASLNSLVNSQAQGFAQNMWLDAATKTTIEELSGMNFFAVIHGSIHTPKLNNSILAGITRSSIIRLAQDAGFQVFERNMAVDDLIKDIKSLACTEMFACGTAAVVTSVAALGEADGTLYSLKQPAGPVAAQLKTLLENIQRGKSNDPYQWLTWV